jgi:uncharacterized protein YaaW (UPF0174 family)
LSSVSDVRGMRTEVLQLNAEVRTMTNLMANGNLSLRDFLVLSRALFGSNPQMAKILADIQLFIALMGTARAMNKMFQLELGPVGWAILGATTVIAIAGYSIYENTTGV